MDTSFRNDKKGVPTKNSLWRRTRFIRGSGFTTPLEGKQKMISRGERIVLSEYGTLSMRKSKKVQYNMNQKIETLNVT